MITISSLDDLADYVELITIKKYIDEVVLEMQDLSTHTEDLASIYFTTKERIEFLENKLAPWKNELEKELNEMFKKNKKI